MTPANLVIYAVVIALLIYRVSRPQRTSVARMWVMVTLLMLIAVLGVYQTAKIFQPAPWEIVVAVILGLLAGIPVGVLRGHHTIVKATDRHGVMQLGPSWATALIFIGAFIVRFVIRTLLPPTSTAGMIVSDGLIFFAVGMIGATYYAVYRKYEALDRTTTS